MHVCNVFITRKIYLHKETRHIITAIGVFISDGVYQNMYKVLNIELRLFTVEACYYSAHILNAFRMRLDKQIKVDQRSTPLLP